MRDPNRLDGFYKRLYQLHKEYAPDLTIVQFLLKFFDQYMRDPFFPEEDELQAAFEEWAGGNTQAEHKSGESKVSEEDWNTIRDIHKKTFPDWRFGQLMVNFLGCVTCKRPELTDAKFINYLNQYATGERPHD